MASQLPARQTCIMVLHLQTAAMICSQSSAVLLQTQNLIFVYLLVMSLSTSALESQLMTWFQQEPPSVAVKLH